MLQKKQLIHPNRKPEPTEQTTRNVGTTPCMRLDTGQLPPPSKTRSYLSPFPHPWPRKALGVSSSGLHMSSVLLGSHTQLRTGCHSPPCLSVALRHINNSFGLVIQYLLETTHPVRIIGERAGGHDPGSGHVTDTLSQHSY